MRKFYFFKYLPIVLALNLFGLLDSKGALASGGTVHLEVSDQARAHIKNSSLKDLIKTYIDHYRSGTLHPDALLDVKDNSGKKKDSAHQSNFMIALIDIAITRYCRPAVTEKTKTLAELVKLADCGKALSFIMGVVSHNVEDAHFDEHYVGKGGQKPNVADECGIRPTKKNEKSWSDLAEGFTDNDLDICMAKNLAGPGLFKPTSFRSFEDKGWAVVPRPKAAKGHDTPFIDARKGGEWWSCPKSKPRRTAYAVTHKHACATKNIIGEKLSSAHYYSKVHQKKPSGAIQVGAKFYKCPEGYSITAAGRIRQDPKACEIRNYCRTIKHSDSYWGKGVKLGAVDTQLSFVVEAYKAVGRDFSEKSILDVSQERHRLFKVLEPSATMKSFKPYWDKCRWGYDNLVKGKGGIEDSAKTVAEFLDHLYILIGDKIHKNIAFEITGGPSKRDYGLRQGKKVIYSLK